MGKSFYEDTLDSKANYPQALKMFLKADELDFRDACEYLAHMYFYGIGTNPDNQKSAFFCEKAALYGNIEAQFKMGMIYLRGIGVKRDYFLAKKWFKQAAKRNHAYAQYLLGLIYLFGKDSAQDLNEATKWFKKAAYLDILLSNKEKISNWALHCVTDLHKKDDLIIKALFKLWKINLKLDISDLNIKNATKIYDWIMQFDTKKAAVCLMDLNPELRNIIIKTYAENNASRALTSKELREKKHCNKGSMR